MVVSSKSRVNALRFNSTNYTSTANFKLFQKAIKAINFPIKSANIFISDEFYVGNFESYKKWTDFGVLCIEMETSGLYIISVKHNINACFDFFSNQRICL